MHVASVPHRLHGVLQEIDEGLLKQAGIGVRDDAVLDLLVHDHPRGDRHRPDRLGEQVSHVHRGPLGWVVAGHVQEVGHDAIAGLDLLRDLVDVLGRPVVVLHPALEDEQRGLDDPEGIAEIVADAGRELPDGRQPFGATQAFVGVVAVGLEHDRQLEVEQLVDRVARGHEGLAVVREGVLEHPPVVEAHHVDRRHHVLLGQGDLHVAAADAGPQLVERLVVGSGESPVHPLLQGPLEPVDLGLSR